MLEVFSGLLWPCFCLTLQDKPSVVWLMFARVGLFLMGSENRNRALMCTRLQKKNNNSLDFMITTFSLTEILTFCQVDVL